jgi:hypothetical protein
MTRPITKTYGVWNPIPQELVKQIIEYYQAGYSTVETGKKFSVNAGCVTKLLRRNGLNTRGIRYKSGGKEKEIIAYYLSGKNAVEAAKHFGIGSTRIYEILEENGIKRRSTIKSLAEKRATKNTWEKNKKKLNPMYKLESYLRSRVYIVLKRNGFKKKTRMYFLLGTDYQTVKAHIESQFTEGMTWENYGLYTWHIDHKIPLASAKTEEELLKLFHYTNLQPLWAKDNLSKHAKLNWIKGGRYGD